MNPKDNEHSQLFYSSDDGKTWKAFPKDSVQLESITLSEVYMLKLDLSEEDAAKVWGQLEGLEIVPRE